MDIGLSFDREAFDADHGSAWWLLQAIGVMGMKFVGDVKKRYRYALEPDLGSKGS